VVVGRWHGEGAGAGVMCHWSGRENRHIRGRAIRIEKSSNNGTSTRGRTSIGKGEGHLMWWGRGARMTKEQQEWNEQCGQ